jgi:hypothetical protein
VDKYPLDPETFNCKRNFKNIHIYVYTYINMKIVPKSLVKYLHISSNRVM